MTNRIPTVEKFMTRSALTIEHSASLNAALVMMGSEGIRHLPVLSNGEVIGIVSIRDLHLLKTFDGVNGDKTRVMEAMSSPVYTVRETTPIHTVAKKMADDKLGSALVLDEQSVVLGIFTVTDGLMALHDAYA